MKRNLYRCFLFETILLLLATACSHSSTTENEDFAEMDEGERYVFVTRNKLDTWRAEAEEFDNFEDRGYLALQIAEIEIKLDELEVAPRSEWVQRQTEIDFAFEGLERGFIAAE